MKSSQNFENLIGVYYACKILWKPHDGASRLECPKPLTRCEISHGGFQTLVNMIRFFKWILCGAEEKTTFGILFMTGLISNEIGDHTWLILSFQKLKFPILRYLDTNKRQHCNTTDFSSSQITVIWACQHYVMKLFTSVIQSNVM